MLKEIWFKQNTNTNQALNSNTGLQSNKEIFPIIVNYNSFETNLAKGFKRILTNNREFDKFRLINAFKIHSNLKRLLVRSELKPIDVNVNNTNNLLIRRPNSRVTNRFICCNGTRCMTCKFHAFDCDSFTSTTFNATFSFTDSFNCKTRNIIYLITCSKCNVQYVGETGRCLSERLKNHRSCILTRKPTPISAHFNEPGHEITRHLKAITIDKITDSIDSTRTRKERELIWWDRLGTRYPQGLNASLTNNTLFSKFLSAD